MVTVDGLKMGKSLDNFVTAAQALADHPTAAVRLALIGGHYRATVEYNAAATHEAERVWERFVSTARRAAERLDRKSTRLNSSHVAISYAVFCVQKKNTKSNREQ